MKNGSNQINIILNTFPGYQKPKLKNIYFVFDNEIVGYAKPMQVLGDILASFYVEDK